MINKSLENSQYYDWSKEQIEWIRNYYTNHGIKSTTKEFNRVFNCNVSISPIILLTKKYNMEHCNPNAWTKEQENWIIDNYEKYDCETLRKKFNFLFKTNKTLSAIYSRTQRLGLNTKILWFTKEEKDWLINNRCNKKSCKQLIKEFENKFKKTISYSRLYSILKRNGVYKTIDRKGNRFAQPTYKIGDEIISHGYTYVKFKDDIGEEWKNYKSKHQIVWEEYNQREVPKGYFIIFKDNNRNNFDINNLACISRKTGTLLNFNGLRNKGEITETAIMLGELMDLNDKERDENECSK